MDFFAIANKFQEDVFFDFESGEDCLGVKPTCLLPTKKLAEQVIEDELSIDYVPLKITQDTYRDGVWVTTRDFLEDWDG